MRSWACYRAGQEAPTSTALEHDSGIQVEELDWLSWHRGIAKATGDQAPGAQEAFVRRTKIDKLEPTLAHDDGPMAPALGGGRAPSKDPDERALKILFKSYWTAAGWRASPETSPDDLAYAIAAGVMFAPRTLSHDDLVGDLTGTCSRLAPRDVGAAFLASLGSRRLDLRSALGSFVFWRHLPDHRKPSGSSHVCDQCPIEDYYHERHHELSGLNFERHKWGGLRHFDPAYAWLDLTELVGAARPEPTAEDYAILRAVLRTACDAPIGARPGVLEKALATIVKSNQAERQVLIRLLAYAGVLDCSPYPSYLAGWPQLDERAIVHNEWGYPAGWWRGSGAVNRDATVYFFGEAALD